jgi:hypothetical protein
LPVLVYLAAETIVVLAAYPNATRADFGICTPAVTGTLKGYDQLLNLVLDEAIEFERGITRHSLISSCAPKRCKVMHYI